MSHTYLGAINKLNYQYVYPKIANKKDEYVCPECNKDLILCQGKIRVQYFRHKVSINQCHYYNSPTETQIHKDAKLLLKYFLERKIPISFIRSCIMCKKNQEFQIPELTETSNIKLEYRFEYNGPKIADVAYINDNELLYIFEICNTHKTLSINRPEPWFEIDAKKLIIISNNGLSKIKIPCIRCEKCDDCEEGVIKNIKKHTDKKNAIKILLSWFVDNNFPFRFKDFSGISPFYFGDFDGIYEYDEYDENHSGSMCFPSSYKPDIFINDKGNTRYHINLTKKLYSIKCKKDYDDYCVGLYYVDIKWILQQKTIPIKIECIRVFNKCIREPNQPMIHIINTIGITIGIDDNKFVYLNIEFSKIDIIKKYGGKWNEENKLWYITKSIYIKNKNYIDEFIGDKINWYCNGHLNSEKKYCNGHSNCEYCNGYTHLNRDNKNCNGYSDCEYCHPNLNSDKYCYINFT